MIIFSFFLFSLIGFLSFFISYYFLLLLIPISFLSRYWTKSKKVVLLGILLTALSFFVSYLYPKGGEVSGTIKGIVIHKKESYYFLLTIKGKYLVYDSNNNINLFSIIQLNGYSSKLSFSHYEQGFDFKGYLNGQGVYYLFNAKNISILFKPLEISKPFQEWTGKFLNDDTREIVHSFLFGKGIDSEKIELLNIFTLPSIFSLSGIHISALLKVITNLTRSKMKDKNNILVLVILFLFLVLSGFKFTIRRIFLFYFIRTISILFFKVKLKSLEVLSLSCMIMMFFEPYLIMTSSFNYSIPFLFFIRLFPIKSKGIKGYILFVLQLTLFYLPYKLVSDYQISFLGVLLQIILSPIMILVFVLSLLLVIPYIGFLINIMVDLILKILSIGTSFNMVFISGRIQIYQVVIYYFLFSFSLILYRYKYMFYSKEFGVVLSLFTSSFFVPDFFNHYEVHFIDVDQGDCTLIRNRRANFLIDTGGIIGIDLAKECLIKYFKRINIRKLDYVVLTHLDYDHYGALDSLEKNFRVNKVLQVEDFISNNNTYYLDSLTIYNLNNYDLNITKDKNYHSGVYSFNIKNNSFLIMGDAPKEIEYKIINDKKDLTVDYLKVGHHGSDTSTSEEFIKHINPKEAIISCGEKNRYKFPHENVLNVLNKYNVKIRRTDLEGTIVYKFV